jgi:acyl transferase domain-containing protein
MCFAKTQVLSPTGDARPFSRNADGTVLGEGVGLLVLKRLADAERDGNRIYAVIQGIGSASDGRSQSIFSPRSEGQVKALEAAYSTAGIDPATVDAVEPTAPAPASSQVIQASAGHGKTAANGNRCHTGLSQIHDPAHQTAAGAALVKRLAVYHKVLPPTLKADEPDVALGLDASPFYLNTRTRPWVSPAGGHPRRAGVSAFGFGGSNFHLVLEEHRPEKPRVAWDGSVEILAFSADDAGCIAPSASSPAAAEPLPEPAWAGAARAAPVSIPGIPSGASRGEHQPASSKPQRRRRLCKAMAIRTSSSTPARISAARRNGRLAFCS